MHQENCSYRYLLLLGYSCRYYSRNHILKYCNYSNRRLREYIHYSDQLIFNARVPLLPFHPWNDELCLWVTEFRNKSKAKIQNPHDDQKCFKIIDGVSSSWLFRPKSCTRRSTSKQNLCVVYGSRNWIFVVAQQLPHLRICNFTRIRGRRCVSSFCLAIEIFLSLLICITIIV